MLKGNNNQYKKQNLSRIQAQFTKNFSKKKFIKKTMA